MYASTESRWQRIAFAAAAAATAVLVACALAVPAAHAASPKSITAYNASTGKLVLVKGKSYKVGAKVSPAKASQKLGYKSSKKSVATVSSKGTIKAKRYGKATVTVWSKTKKSVKKKISIKVVKKSAYKKAKSVKITGVKSLNMKVGTAPKTLQLKGKVSPANASNKNLKWKSSDKSVATVSAKGKVTAKKAGTVKITCWAAAETKVKKTASIKVTAPAKPAPAVPTKPAPAIVEKGVSGTCTWTIDADGLLTVKPSNGKSGTLERVTVTYGEGFSWQGMPWCEIDVSPKIVSAKVLPGVGGTDLSYMFSDCKNLESVELADSFDASAAVDMTFMFGYCPSLKTVKLPATLNAPALKSVCGMFGYCPSLRTVKLPTTFNTPELVDMAGMFGYCPSLQSLEFPKTFDTSKVTSMESLFSGCSSLRSVRFPTSFNISKVINMDSMFEGCAQLKLDCSSWNVEGVTHRDFFAWGSPGVVVPGEKIKEGTCGNCAWNIDWSRNLNIKPANDTSGSLVKTTIYSGGYYEGMPWCDATVADTFKSAMVFPGVSSSDPSAMFANCTSLEMVDLKNLDFSDATDLNHMFHNCPKLIELELPDGFNTSKVTNMDGMFCDCKKLEFDCSAWDVSKVTSHIYFNEGASGVKPPSWGVG